MATTLPTTLPPLAPDPPISWRDPKTLTRKKNRARRLRVARAAEAVVYAARKSADRRGDAAFEAVIVSCEHTSPADPVLHITVDVLDAGRNLLARAHYRLLEESDNITVPITLHFVGDA